MVKRSVFYPTHMSKPSARKKKTGKSSRLLTRLSGNHILISPFILPLLFLLVCVSLSSLCFSSSLWPVLYVSFLSLRFSFGLSAHLARRKENTTGDPGEKTRKGPKSDAGRKIIDA